jgi:ADP-ribosylglycohydrolase
MLHPKITDSERLSKTLGALLGVHAGDSLGATVEFFRWEQLKEAYPTGLREIVGGGPFNWPAGHATDDTDLTRAVLLAYRDRDKCQKEGGEKGDFDVVKTAADYSVDWLTGDWPGRIKGTWPADIGGATSIGLTKYEKSRNPKTCGAGPGNAGNGSLMRCIPTALFTTDPAQRIAESMAISAFTHNDGTCTVSCAAYNEIVAALLSGKSLEDAVEIGIQTAENLDCPAVSRAISLGLTLSLPRIADKGPGKDLPKRASGWVLESLTIAIAALMDKRSFEDCLVDVVRIGADTDTNAAIAGGLLGARDGVGGIPERWLADLQFKEEFEEIATGMLRGKETVDTLGG